MCLCVSKTICLKSDQIIVSLVYIMSHDALLIQYEKCSVSRNICIKYIMSVFDMLFFFKCIVVFNLSFFLKGEEVFVEQGGIFFFLLDSKKSSSGSQPFFV